MARTEDRASPGHYYPRVKVALGLATCLVGAVLMSCASVTAPSKLNVLRPEPGQIVFGQELVDNGTAVTEPAACINPDLAIAFVGKFSKSVSGRVDVEVSRGGGAASVKLTHTLVGGIDSLHDGFRPREFQGPARYTFTMVLEGSESLATGTLGVDSSPPNGSC